MVMAEAGRRVQIEAAVAAGLLQAGLPVTGSQATPLTTLVCQTQYLGAGIFQAAFPVRCCGCKPQFPQVHLKLPWQADGGVFVHDVGMRISPLQGIGQDSGAIVNKMERHHMRVHVSSSLLAPDSPR